MYNQYISKESIEKILGMAGNICLTPNEMVPRVKVTFFPFSPQNLSEEIKDFSNDLKAVLTKIGVEIIPFEETLISLPTSKIVKWYIFAFINK